MSLEQSSVWCGIAFQRTIYILHEKNQMGFLLFLVKISLGEKKGGHIRVPALLGARIRGPRWPRSRSASKFRLPRNAKAKLQLLSIELQKKRNKKETLRWGPALAGLGGLAHARRQIHFPARRADKKTNVRFYTSVG